MTHLSRRRLLQHMVAAAGATTLLAACGPAAPAASPTAPAPAATRPPTQQPAQPTAVSAAPTSAPTAAATVASAAAGKPGGIKIFRMGLSGDATELDPVRSTTEANNPPAEALYNYIGRYTYHPPLGTQILPELAEGWDVQDGARTYVFHLRKGVKYHDGS